MDEYGSTFQKLRNDKGFTLKEVAANIMSVTALSNFENGNTGIKASNLFQILARIHVSASEFLFEYDQHAQLDIYRLIDSVISTEKSDQFPRFALQKLSDKYAKRYEETKEIRFLHFNILCKFAAEPSAITPQEKEIIRNYILTVKRMDEYEFYLMNFFSLLFDIEELHDVYDRMNEDILHIHPLTWVNPHHMFLNRCFHFIRREEIPLARASLDQFLENAPRTTMDSSESHILAYFLGGLINIAEGNESGKKQCDDVLEFLEKLPGYDATINQLMLWVNLCIDMEAK